MSKIHQTYKNDIGRMSSNAEASNYDRKSNDSSFAPQGFLNLLNMFSPMKKLKTTTDHIDSYVTRDLRSYLRQHISSGCQKLVENVADSKPTIVFALYEDFRCIQLWVQRNKVLRVLHFKLG